LSAARSAPRQATSRAAWAGGTREVGFAHRGVGEAPVCVEVGVLREIQNELDWGKLPAAEGVHKVQVKRRRDVSKTSAGPAQVPSASRGGRTPDLLASRCKRGSREHRAPERSPGGKGSRAPCCLPACNGETCASSPYGVGERCASGLYRGEGEGGRGPAQGQHEALALRGAERLAVVRAKADRHLRQAVAHPLERSAGSAIQPQRPNTRAREWPASLPQPTQRA